MVLVYSARLRRRAVTRPGSCLVLRSALSNSAWRNWTTVSSVGGRGTPLGGISPARSLRRITSQPSRCSVRDDALVNAPRSTLPLARFSLWQGEQVVARTGATVFSKVGMSPARARAAAASEYTTSLDLDTILDFGLIV